MTKPQIPVPQLPKAKPGSHTVLLKADTYNKLAQGVSSGTNQGTSGEPSQGQFTNPATIRMIATDTVNRLAYQAVGIGPPMEPDPSIEGWESRAYEIATTVDAESIAILQIGTGTENEISTAVVVGETIAIVDVSDINHRYAEPGPDDGFLVSTTQPTSIVILFAPSTGVGIECKCLMGGSAGSVIRMAITDEDIDPGSSGLVTIYADDPAASTGDQVTLHNKWVGQDPAKPETKISSGKRVFMSLFDGIWRPIAADCEIIPEYFETLTGTTANEPGTWVLL